MKDNNLLSGINTTLIPLIGMASVMSIAGGLMNMFGLGSSKKETLKGVVDLVIDGYEKDLQEQRNIISDRDKIIDELKQKLLLLEKTRVTKR